MITVEKLEKGTYFDDAFKISFRYDPTTVAKVKELAERRYLPEDRAWEIPAHELPALIEKVGLSNIKSEEAVVQALNTKEIEDKREATQERLKGIKPVRDFDFKTAPLPHQIEAFNYGMEKNSLLIGDEQGLGKTKESIDICVARKKELIKTLIVCGVNSVKYNWEKEIQIHSNEGCVMVDGKTMDVRVQQLNDWYRGSSYFGVINIESLRNEKIQEAKKQEEVKIVEKVNTKTVEKELKENPTPVPEQIKLTDYPQVFYATKPEAKNTQALLDYMNSKTSVDPNVVALYTKMDKLCDGLSDEVVLKVTHGEHRVKRSWNRNFEYVFDVGIPKINPNYIGTYDTNLHEEMHFLDMLITVKDNKDRLPSKMFSQSYKPLVEAFDKATPVIGDKAKKLFEDFAKECDIIYKKQQETFNTQHEDLKEQYRSGKIDWKKYNSLYKKLSKEVNEEADNERRALFGGGVSGLQDIYDAVSKGTFRDTGQVTYGHGSAYYTDRRRTNLNCSESLANYASLCVGHPELIDILAEDYPEIVTALRGCVEAMLKEVPK